MIEDEEVKVAENPEEAFWEELRKRTEKAIENCEHEIVVQRHVLALCYEKLGKEMEKPEYVK